MRSRAQGARLRDLGCARWSASASVPTRARLRARRHAFNPVHLSPLQYCKRWETPVRPGVPTLPKPAAPPSLHSRAPPLTLAPMFVGRISLHSPPHSPPFHKALSGIRPPSPGLPTRRVPCSTSSPSHPFLPLYSSSSETNVLLCLTSLPPYTRLLLLLGHGLLPPCASSPKPVPQLFCPASWLAGW